MAARIAPEPIRSAPPAPDFRSRQPLFGETSPPSHDASAAPPSHADALPPPPQPGVAFVAAVLSGQLAPRPETPRELMMRIGQAWAPPASDLRLTDKKI